MDVSDVFPTIIKTDLHATILHIFVTILGTGVCQASVVPQSLPIFRRFISIVAAEVQPDTKSQLLNTLARMQLILRNAQKRETEASLPCEKNTLLTSTILLSTAPKVFVDSESLVQKFVGELIECVESKMTSRVASGCARTLMMAGVCSRQLFAHSIGFLANPSEVEGMDDSRSFVAQTLTAYIPRVAEEGRAAAIAVVMSALLSRAANEGASTHQGTASRLLELAAADNASFRSIVACMETEDKSLLEQVLKARAGAQVKQDYSGGGEPTIALKMNF